jgi:hypothetical protein
MIKRIKIILILLLVLFGIYGSVIAFNVLYNPKSQTTVIENSADNLKIEGIGSYVNGDYEKAKELLNKAKTEYTSINDNNNLIDIDSILNFIRIEESKNNIPIILSTEVN